MLKILICEDDKLQCSRLENFVKSYMVANEIDYKLTVYNNAEDAIKDCDNDICYDICLLDIILPNKSGIDLAKVIRKYDKHSYIVFLTTSREFAVESYEVKAYNYLLKPFDSEIMNNLMDDILDNMYVRDDKFVTFTNRGSINRVLLRDIIFCESYKRKIIIHVKDMDEFSVPDKLDEVEAMINDKRFIRCHKSYLVNMDIISRLEGRNFILNEQTIIPIPKENLNTIKKIYFDYLFEKAK